MKKFFLEHKNLIYIIIALIIALIIIGIVIIANYSPSEEMEQLTPINDYFKNVFDKL